MSSTLARYYDTLKPKPSLSNMTRRYGNAMNLLSRMGGTVRRNSRIGLGKRRRLNSGRTMTMTKRKRVSRRGILGGTNANVRLIYNKSRMPRRMRRRWRSFSKKVNFIQEKDLGTRTVLINDQIVQARGTAAAGQNTLTLALYPFYNATNGWLNDMQAPDNENTGNPTASAGITTNINTKFFYHSAVMDLTIRNTSTLYNGSTYSLDSSAAIELDLYEVSFRHEASDRSNQFVDFSSMLNAYAVPSIGGASAAITISDRGATPFDFPAPLSRFNIKIWKKTKYFIPNGQTITYQVRDPKRHVLEKGELQLNDGWYRPGWTRTIFLIYKLVPGLTQGSTASTYQAQVTVGSTRKYMYKIEGANEPRSNLYGASYTPSVNA